MGIIIAKFRKKKTTLEVLEKLENQIKSIEEFRRNTEQAQKKIVKRFIIISILVYLITGVIIYVYFFPASVYERLFYIIPLIIIPVLLLFIKKILNWYYNRKMKKNQKKLTSLKDEKKKILDEVMDKETYKVAKTILEKFAPEQITKRNSLQTEITPMRPAPSSFGTTQSALRYRGTPQFPVPQSRLPLPGTPFGAVPSSLVRRPLMSAGATPGPQRINSDTVMVPSSLGRPMIPGTPLPLPRDILPRDRSVLDKMVDYLVGDGPSNRFALICRNCSSHNGMALKEEFDYLSFRCCYCMSFNPARKKRPMAPKLEDTLAIKAKSSDVSDSENSETDSEKEGPIITEPRGDTPDLSKEEADDKEEIECNSSGDAKVSPVSEVTAMEVDSSSEAIEENVAESIKDINDEDCQDYISEETTKD